MPPIENELAEDDFDSAVFSYLYLFEGRREREAMNRQALASAYELARLLAPLFGGEVRDDGGDNEEW